MGRHDECRYGSCYHTTRYKIGVCKGLRRVEIHPNAGRLSLVIQQIVGPAAAVDPAAIQRSSIAEDKLVVPPAAVEVGLIVRRHDLDCVGIRIGVRENLQRANHAVKGCVHNLRRRRRRRGQRDVRCAYTAVVDRHRGRC